MESGKSGMFAEARRKVLARSVAAAVAALLVAGQDPAAPPTAGEAATQETPGLQATQVSVAVDREGSRRRFRATVVRVDADVVTIFTAAHCVSEADKGWPVALLFGGGVVVEGVVEAVARNPLYRPNQPKEIPGPDNAVARLRFKLGAEHGPANVARAAFGSLRTIPALTTKFYPGPGGRSVDVRMIDGRGVEHAVLAGNYSNPRWLEWGLAYQPIPGDSGGGVVVVRPGPNGQSRPILIGIIVGRDDRGGGASLISLDQPWVAEALKPPPARGS